MTEPITYIAKPKRGQPEIEVRYDICQPKPTSYPLKAVELCDVEPGDKVWELVSHTALTYQGICEAKSEALFDDDDPRADPENLEHDDRHFLVCRGKWPDVAEEAETIKLPKHAIVFVELGNR